MLLPKMSDAFFMQSGVAFSIAERRCVATGSGTEDAQKRTVFSSDKNLSMAERYAFRILMTPRKRR